MAIGDTIRGESGSVKTGSTPVEVLKITGWGLNKKSDVSNVTASGHGGWEQFTPNGIKGWSGSFEGFLTAGEDDLSMDTIIDVELVVNENVKFAGKAIITSEDYTLTVPGTDSVKIARSFQGTGVLTKTDTSA